MTEVGLGLLVAGALYGLRHGFDVDHLVAISDIAATSGNRKRSRRLALLYIAGHAVVLLALGLGAVALGARVPSSIDGVMTRVIGITLIALGLFLLYRIARDGARVRLRSRWMLVADGFRAASRRLSREVVVIEHSHEHVHDVLHQHEHAPTGGGGQASAVAVATHTHVHSHIATMPDDPFGSYGALGVIAIGMVHGIGAETPTQLLLFASAAGAGTPGVGMAVVAAFVVGLVTANFVVSLVATNSAGVQTRWPRVYVGVAVLVALFSLVVGSAYLLGHADPVHLLLGL